MPHEYGFSERLAMSEGVSENLDIGSLLVEQIPGAVSAHRAHVSNDRHGTDWWVEMAASKVPLSIDVKAREPDPVKRGWGDDYALETWSVLAQKKVGWTRDPTKQTDYILWVWHETGRWALVPFRLLCAVFSDRWEEWRELGIRKTGGFRTEVQSSGTWRSECVFVPRQTVWREIYGRFSGRLPEREANRQTSIPGVA